MGTKRHIVIFLYVSIICVFAGSNVTADTVIPYELNNGWTYEEGYPDTLQLTENPSGGIIANINIPTGIDDGGLVASRHDLPDYSLYNDGFIQLEYSSFSSEVTGNPGGPDLCLEVEFYDADDVFYEMGIEVSQDDGVFYFGTWLESIENDSYYQTPIPDGLSVTDSILGFYSNGSLVHPYFMDSTGSVLYPFDAWDVSGIAGIHEYYVDNDFEGTTTAGGTIIASANLERVVYGLGTPPKPPVVDDDLDIDWIGVTSMKQFRDGVPQGDYPWSLDIWVHVIEPGTLDHIDVTKPDDSNPFVTLYEEDASGWWNCSLDDDYDSLDALRVVYKEGIYKFDCRDSESRLIKSLDIAYNGLPGEPTGPVEFIYPSTNGQSGIIINPTFTWSVSSDAGDALMTVVDNDEVVYFDAPVSISSMSWTPGPLLADHEYELDISVMNIKDWAGGPAFPTTTDDTGDTFSYSYMIEYLNEIVFITLPLNDPIEEIEEILDFVDESVDVGTLTGDGPGKSAGNRLNALRNKLEDARGLIEAGRYEEACDQFWSTYRKCDGEPRPPDFVTGGAADDLADMILMMMDDLGC